MLLGLSSEKTAVRVWDVPIFEVEGRRSKVEGQSLPRPTVSPWLLHEAGTPGQVVDTN